MALISGCGQQQVVEDKVGSEAWDSHEFGASREGPWISGGVGGEHNACCIKRAWLPAVEVAARLAGMAVRGNAVVGRVVGGILVCRISSRQARVEELAT